MTTTTASTAQGEVTTLLQRLSNSTDPKSAVSAEDVTLIARCLARTSNKNERSFAYICLTRIIGQGGAQSGNEINGDVERIFQPILDPFQQVEEVSPEQCIPAANLLASLFPLCPIAGQSLLTAPVLPAKDSPDLMAILLEMAELGSELQVAFAELLAAAAGTKVGRELVRARAMEWLNGALGFGKTEPELGALCAVALSKVGRELQPGQDDVEQDLPVDEVELCDKMIALIESSASNRHGLLPALEGLSVLSTKGRIKQHLAYHPTFLKRLLMLSPIPTARGGSLPITPRSSIGSIEPEKLFEPVETSLCYGITTILANLSSRKPVQSAEDKQIAQLRAMAVSGGAKKGMVAPEDDPLDDIPAVKERVTRLYKAGVVTALTGLVRAESTRVKQELGKLCLNLLEEKKDRSGFLKDGGFKVLNSIIRDLTVLNKDPSSTGGISRTLSDQSHSQHLDILPAIQALAKLVITTPPQLLFPPPHLTTSLNALSPLYSLLTHPKSNLLQTFEALMALTNLASITPNIADRIVTATVIPVQVDHGMWQGSGREDTVRIINKVEECMLEDNDLVRRAATELICNLAGSEKGFEHFTGEKFSGVDNPTPSKVNPRVQSRLNVLLVLTNSDDLPTRIAAGGALAIMTESPLACSGLLQQPDSKEGESSKKTVWNRLSTLLAPEEVEEEGEKIALISTQPPDEGMILRTVCACVNVISYLSEVDQARLKAELVRIADSGLEARLMDVLRMQVGQDVLRPTVEALQMLKKYRK